MSRIDAIGPLPGVSRVFTFPDWRFTPTHNTLMFNFKKQVSTEEDAIHIIIQAYGLNTIAAARQLKCPAVLAKDWVILETLFKSSSTRKQALLNGLKYRDRVYYPVTTCSQVSSCTVISFFGMPVQPEKDAISFAATKVQDIWSAGAEGELDNVSGRAGIKISNNPSGSIGTTRGFTRNDRNAFNDSNAIQNINSTDSSSSTHHLPLIKDSHIWLQKNRYGVFSGNATVVVDGYNDIIAKKKNGSLAYYVAAPEYPLLEIYIRRCQMYCTRCRTLNHHQTEDCIDVEASDLDDPNDEYEIHKDDNDDQKKPVNEEGCLEEEDSDADPDYTFVESSPSESDSDSDDNGMDLDTCPRGKSV